MSDDGGLNLGESCKNGEKWTYLGFILEVVLTGPANDLGVEGEGKKG